MGIAANFSVYRCVDKDSLILEYDDLGDEVDGWGELEPYPYEAAEQVHNFFHKLYVERGGKDKWIYDDYLRVLPEDLDALDEVIRKDLELVEQFDAQFILVSLDRLKEFYEEKLAKWITYARENIKAGHTVVFHIND